MFFCLLFSQEKQAARRPPWETKNITLSEYLPIPIQHLPAVEGDEVRGQVGILATEGSPDQFRIKPRILGPHHCVQGEGVALALQIESLDQWDQVHLRIACLGLVGLFPDDQAVPAEQLLHGGLRLLGAALRVLKIHNVIEVGQLLQLPLCRITLVDDDALRHGGSEPRRHLLERHLLADGEHGRGPVAALARRDAAQQGAGGRDHDARLAAREAAERGIESIGSVPDAFKVSVRKDAIALFEKHGIFNEAELHARYEINMENLVKKIQIESRVLADLAANHIVPTAIRYQNILIQNVKGLKDILPDEYADMAAEEIRTIRKIARYVKAIRENTYHMVDARKKYNAMDDIVARATGYSEEVQPYLDKIRHDIDKLELIVDDELWPLPKYREMMSIN